MTLVPGTRLGPYEITAPLGAGGMGEVYKAKDTRVDRSVALKVLPEEFFENKESIARFEREARMLASLNHPNIAHLYSFEEIPDSPGSAGRHLLVMELADGQTLAERLLKGPMALDQLLRVSVEIASALAAAHRAGIVHRDMKPGNIMLTKSGVKLLDFGLAKAAASPVQTSSATSLPTELPKNLTQQGTILGTFQYMSPEQLEGKEADARSDIFSFGAVLYEMATARKAFEAKSQASLIAAILQRDPPPVSVVQPMTPPALDRVVKTCLEKDPDERWQSAHDIRSELQWIAQGGLQVGIATPGTARRKGRERIAWMVSALLAVATASLGLLLLAMRGRALVAPSFHPLTFRRGHVTSARFTPDGHTVVYGAMWEGKPIQMFSTRIGSPESEPLSLPPGDVLSVSPSGELAISLGRRFTVWFISSGRLARAPIAGGAPREVLEEVAEASWTPDGQRLLVTRQAQGKWRLECPTGNVLYQTDGWISHARMSPKGDWIAFLEHPFLGADNGKVCLIPTSGKRAMKELTGEWPSVQGLAWHPSGREIWFTGAENGWLSSLYGVTAGGRQRLVLRSPSRLLLHDLDAQGRALLTSEHLRVGAFFGSLGSREQKEVSWLESSFGSGISSDGRFVLLNEQGEGSGKHSGLYLRGLDGAPAVRLGSGFHGLMSPDDRSVLTMSQDGPAVLTILPTGPGDSRPFPSVGLGYRAIGWFPDGKRVIFSAIDEKGSVRLYTQDLSGGPPRAISGEGVAAALGTIPVSPDGRWAAALGLGQRVFLYPIGGGEATPLGELEPGNRPIRFSSDGHVLFCAQSGMDQGAIVALDLATRKLTFTNGLRPGDPAGILTVSPVDVTPDGHHYLYTYARILSDLFLAEGLK